MHSSALAQKWLKCPNCRARTCATNAVPDMRSPGNELKLKTASLMPSEPIICATSILKCVSFSITGPALSTGTLK